MDVETFNKNLILAPGAFLCFLVMFGWQSAFRLEPPDLTFAVVALLQTHALVLAFVLVNRRANVTFLLLSFFLYLLLGAILFPFFAYIEGVFALDFAMMRVVQVLGTVSPLSIVLVIAALTFLDAKLPQSRLFR